LLSNAAKFSARSEVLLKVMPFIENNEPWLVFSVQDHGIGLQPAQLDKLFQPFTQADTSYTRKYGGTGLGLSISKQMTKLMGGHVDVVSQPGQGSTFSVYLPRHVNAPDKAGKKKKVHFSPSDMLTTRENQPLN
jgi:signal transduction histidine kinase